MQIAQRMLLVISVICVLVIGTMMFFREREDKLKKQWECVQTERLLGKICRNGSISLEEYMQYNDALNQRGMASDIRIEEYQVEQDWKGTDYYYLVSWEELMDCFMEDGACSFRPGSIIEFSVKHRSLGQNISSSYYGIIHGKE